VQRFRGGLVCKGFGIRFVPHDSKGLGVPRGELLLGSCLVFRVSVFGFRAKGFGIRFVPHETESFGVPRGGLLRGGLVVVVVPHEWIKGSQLIFGCMVQGLGIRV